MGQAMHRKCKVTVFFFFFFSKQLVHSLSSEFNKRTSLQKQVHNLLGCGVGIKKEISLYTCIVFEFRVSTYVSQNMSSRPTHYPSHPILICSWTCLCINCLLVVFRFPLTCNLFLLKKKKKYLPLFCWLIRVHDGTPIDIFGEPLIS